MWRWLVLFIFGLWPSLGLASALVYPQPEAEFDRRTHYPLALLQLALAASGDLPKLQPSATPMQQGRALKQLALGRELDLVWSMTTAERERDLLAVRIPIDKGLIGWRLLLVRQAELPRFAGIDANRLRLLLAGQGHDWPDLAILEHNGFRLMASSSYGSLFELLRQQRIHYFPRGLSDISVEQARYAGQGLAIAPDLALHYPAALYYFVNRNNVQLAERLRQGLEVILADGRFEALFQASYGPLLQQLQLERRRVIELDNPLLPAQTPLARQQLWYRPQAAAVVQ